MGASSPMAVLRVSRACINNLATSKCSSRRKFLSHVVAATQSASRRFAAGLRARLHRRMQTSRRRHRYVATMHASAAVTHCVSCSLASSSRDYLIVAKGCELTMFEVASGGLTQKSHSQVSGRIAAIVAFENLQRSSDMLLAGSCAIFCGVSDTSSFRSWWNNACSIFWPWVQTKNCYRYQGPI